MELHCQHLSPSLGLFLTASPFHRKWKMGCSFYPDYTNKQTINGCFSASLRNAAVSLLSLHSFMLGSSSIVQTFSLWEIFCAFFLWEFTRFCLCGWTLIISGNKRKKRWSVSHLMTLCSAHEHELHYPNVRFWKVYISWHMKATVPIFWPCSLHFVSLLLKVIYFIWDLLLHKIWNCS